MHFYCIHSNDCCRVFLLPVQHTLTVTSFALIARNLVNLNILKLCWISYRCKATYSFSLLSLFFIKKWWDCHYSTTHTIVHWITIYVTMPLNLVQCLVYNLILLILYGHFIWMMKWAVYASLVKSPISLYKQTIHNMDHWWNVLGIILLTYCF